MPGLSVGTGRRRLGAGVSQAAQSVQDLIGMLLQNRMVLERQGAENQAIAARDLFQQVGSQVNQLGPEQVRKFGPEAVSSQYAGLKRRLPGPMQGMLGDAPDFASMDQPYDEKMAALTHELSGVTNADDPTLTAAGLRKRAPGFGVKPDLEIPNLLPGGMGGPSGQTVEDPAFTELEKLAENQRTGLLAKEQRTPVTDFSSGTGVTSFKTNRELGSQGSISSERTPQQEGQRQADVTRATEQARADVANDPRNIKGFVDRASAEAYARELGSQRADKQMGAGSFSPQYDVIEDKGTGLFRVIDKRAEVGGPGIQTSVPATDAQATAFDYANQATAAHNTMTKLESYLLDKGYLGTRAALKLDEINAPESISDPVVKQYAQAMRVFINAGLGRPQSGGAITQQELDTYQKANAFTPGVDAETLKQIQGSRRMALQGLSVRAGDRLGKMFVFLNEVAKAKLPNQTLDQAIADAENSGYRVIR